MKKILAAAILIAVIILSAGCVTQTPGIDTPPAVDTYIGTENDGSIYYADGKIEIWRTDSDGNIRHEVTDTDGAVYKYYINSDGDLIIED